MEENKKQEDSRRLQPKTPGRGQSSMLITRIDKLGLKRPKFGTSTMSLSHGLLAFLHTRSDVPLWTLPFLL